MGPRVLQLANPHVVGTDVEEAQRLLVRNAFGSFDPGGVDGEYGELTAGAVERAKWGSAIRRTPGKQDASAHS